MLAAPVKDKLIGVQQKDSSLFHTHLSRRVLEKHASGAFL
jgi:hypothetical protein